MSLRDAVAELINLWERLPDLVGDGWPELAPRLADAIRRLGAATSDEEYAVRAGELLLLLRPFSEVRRRLHEAFRVDRTRQSGSSGTGGPPAWASLTSELAALAVDMPSDMERPPQQQWINAELESHPAHLPLRPRATYVLAFDVDTTPRPDAVSTARAALEFESSEETIDLTVELVSPDADVQPIEPTLTIERSGPSRNRARFRVTPRQPGEAVLNALFLRGRNFVQLLTLKVQVVAGNGAALEARAAGRPLAAAAKIHDRDLSIVIVEKSDRFEIILTAARSMRASLPHTRMELDDIILEVRRELQELVHLDVPGSGAVYQAGLDIPAAVHQEALRRLARAGYRLYQRVFFSPAADAQLQALGTALRRHAAGPRRRIQVVSQGLLLPWHLMYPVDEYADDDVAADSLMGLRHEIEYIPLDASASGAVVDVEIDTRPGVNIVLAVNEDIDKGGARRLVADQLDYWHQRASPRLQVDVRRDRSEVVALLAHPVRADQILYFYCHATSTRLGERGGPSRSRLVLTGDDLVMLGDLHVDAPARRLLPGTPLVVLNACESSGLSPLFYDGFLPYFIAKGARGVVGTEADTPAVFAAAWAARFFDRLLAGQPIGEILLEVRREFVERHHNLMGLLYALYCDGDTVLQPGFDV